MAATVGLLHKDLEAAQDLAAATDVDLSVVAPTLADADLIFGLPTTNTHKEA
jgi:hypothetical protein